MISFNNWISCVIWERNTFNYFLMVHKIWIEYPQVSYPRIYFLLILCDSLQEESFIYKVESLEPFQNGSCPHRWNCLRQGGARIFCKQKSGCSSEFFLFSFFSIFFLPQGEVSLSAPRFYSMHSDSACPQSFPLWEMPDSNPGLLPQ